MAKGERPANYVPTETFMGRVARYIEDQGEMHPTRTAIVARAGGYRGRVVHALDMLIANGFVGVYADERKVLRHHVLVEYVEGESHVETTPAPRYRTDAQRLTLRRGASPREKVEHAEAVHLQKLAAVQRDRLLAALREGWSLTQAAKEVPTSRGTVLRWTDADPEFAAAVKEAREEGTDRIEDEAYRRAVKGVARPIMYQGKRVMTIREYDTSLLILILKARRPERYRDRKDWRADEAADAVASRTPTASELEQIRKDGLDPDLNEAFDALAKAIGKRERERNEHAE